MPALRDLKKRRCELPVRTDQPQKRSGPLLTATRSFISPTTISAKVPSAATSCHRAHTSSADAVCSTLDPLHCSKDTAQLFAENRHMRTVNRLLVRVASRHRAKAAACRRARGERRRRRSFSCISGVNHVRQSWEYLCGVRAYMPGVVAVWVAMGADAHSEEQTRRPGGNLAAARHLSRTAREPDSRHVRAVMR